MIRRLNSRDADFAIHLEQLLQMEFATASEIHDQVANILLDVKTRGDDAVLEYTARYDALSCSDLTELEILPDQMQEAFADLDPIVKEALQASAQRVRAYHERQKEALGGGRDWLYRDDDDNELGQLVRGMDRVGIYAPGGKAAYPSTVIMTAIPARVAGVKDITLVVPAPGGHVNDALLAAAFLAGVDRIFTIGGAQAIAALAYGTQAISKVDKIVGPGNIYVATAKGMVFGEVGIDMVAGPSEVVIVADKSANVDWLVMDMFAQAEHDELAQSILISTDAALLDAMAISIEKSVAKMERAAIIKQSLSARGALILVSDMIEAVSLVNQIAPEHLELAIERPDEIMTSLKFAGAVFVGNHSAEVVGDYTAGPSHVLPTAGAARFSSPLGVYDFQIRSSLVRCSAKGAVKLSRDAAILAKEEGLFAHAQAASYRVQG